MVCYWYIDQRLASIDECLELLILRPPQTLLELCCIALHIHKAWSILVGVAHSITWTVIFGKLWYFIKHILKAADIVVCYWGVECSTVIK